MAPWALLAALLLPAHGRRLQAPSSLLNADAAFPVGTALGPLLTSQRLGARPWLRPYAGPYLAAEPPLTSKAPRRGPGHLAAVAVDEESDDGEGEAPEERHGAAVFDRAFAHGREFASVQARDGSRWHEIDLPAEWARKFAEGSIVLDSCDGRRRHYAGRARLASMPLAEVAFRAVPTAAEDTARDLAMLERLRPTGCVPTYFESLVLSDETFVLMESARATLGEKIRRQQEMTPWVHDHPLFAPNDLIPIMVDLLRAAAKMTEMGIVHGRLAEEKVLVESSYGRALLTDFRASCLVESEDAVLSCIFKEDVMTGSAYLHAPEMYCGHPNQVANNVWQLGLIFAKMVFGVLPTEHAAAQAMSAETARRLDTTPGGREIIRDFVRSHFSLYDTPGFERLSGSYGDILEIVAGMLATDPQHRWRAETALSAALRVAHYRHISTRSERSPGGLPDDWYDSWQ